MLRTNKKYKKRRSRIDHQENVNILYNFPYGVLEKIRKYLLKNVFNLFIHVCMYYTHLYTRV